MSFFGTSLAIGVAYAALRKLSAWLVEHELAKSLAKYKSELDEKLTRIEVDLQRFSDVLSRRNEREFAVVEKTWELMIQAVGTAQEQLNVNRGAPMFEGLNEDEAEDLISRLPLPDDQKQAIRAADNPMRDRMYARYALVRGLGVSLKTCMDFKNYLSTRQIFIESSILKAFEGIRDELYRVLAHFETYANRSEFVPMTERIALTRTLAVDLNRQIDDLARLVRPHFGFGDDLSGRV